MKADIDIQIVWNENKGEVQLFIGDFRIGLPPAACEQLEKELAAARRVPERAREMAENYERIMHGPAGGDMSDAVVFTRQSFLKVPPCHLLPISEHLLPISEIFYRLQGGAAVACLVHTQEVVGSSPTPATNHGSGDSPPTLERRANDAGIHGEAVFAVDVRHAETTA